MLTVFVADIFGKTTALQELAEQIADTDYLIIDPYQGQMMDFINEQSAYGYFSEKVGLTAYALLLKEKLNRINQPFNLIAFSVGGSAVWLNSEDLSNTKVNRVVCFYASQIRHHLSIQPSCLIELVLPAFESHFKLSEMTAELASKDKLCIIETPYLHGFMNKLSENFNPSAYKRYLHEFLLDQR